MGSSHYQDEQYPSWFNKELSRLAGQIENMGREIEKMKQLYRIKEWKSVTSHSHSPGKDLEEVNSIPPSEESGNRNKRIKLSEDVPEYVLNESSSTSLLNFEDNSNMSFVGSFPTGMFDGDSNCSFNLNDSFIAKMNNKEIKRQRLVLKLKKITKKYFMVNKLIIKDHKMKKFYLDYEQDRYFFQVYVNDLPKTYPCKQQGCLKVFNKITSLQFHKRVHTKLPPGYNAGDFARRFSNHMALESYYPAAHNRLIENLQPHPTQYPGYVNLNRPLPFLKPGLSISLHEDTFHVGEMIGEGGFAKVYGGVWENGPLEERDTVLKIQSPANDWEWYILNQLKWRLAGLGDHPLASRAAWAGGFMSAPRCFTFSGGAGGAVLVSRRQKMGTLLDTINLIKTTDRNLVEPIAIYILADILGLLDILHKTEIVHADLKPDNFLMVEIPGTQPVPSLHLIDFGKSVDLTLTTDNKENVNKEAKVAETDLSLKFDEDLTEEERAEIEIEKNEKEVEEQQARMFTDMGRVGQFHLDLYGIAGCAYCLLFGKYIEVGIVKNRWVVKGNFQRRWKTKFWLQFFDEFLNPKRELESLPDLLKWREKLMDLFVKETDLQDGLKKAQEVIDNKLIASLKKNI